MLEESGPCPVLAGFTLAFFLELRKKLANILFPLKGVAYM